MLNNRTIESLSELAFKSFLKARKFYSFETTPEYDNVIKQHILKMTQPFLQSIADANPDEVKKFLGYCPELAAIARGTVTTVSGYTYENVSTIQLAYVMDDIEMCYVMLPYIKQLPYEMIKDVAKQLSLKMAEVAKQIVESEPYDFTEIVKAISADKQLLSTMVPTASTETLLIEFKKYFHPHPIREGISRIKSHLHEGLSSYIQNHTQWRENQCRWYLKNVIGHLQTRVEKCFEQECSQGLGKLTHQNKSSKRLSTIKNFFNDLPLTYRGSHDSSLLLGRDYCVDIYNGHALLWVKRFDHYLSGMDESLSAHMYEREKLWDNLIERLNRLTCGFNHNTETMSSMIEKSILLKFGKPVWHIPPNEYHAPAVASSKFGTDVDSTSYYYHTNNTEQQLARIDQPVKKKIKLDEISPQPPDNNADLAFFMPNDRDTLEEADHLLALLEEPVPILSIDIRLRTVAEIDFIIRASDSPAAAAASLQISERVLHTHLSQFVYEYPNGRSVQLTYDLMRSMSEAFAKELWGALYNLPMDKEILKNYLDQEEDSTPSNLATPQNNPTFSHYYGLFSQPPADDNTPAYQAYSSSADFKPG